MKKTWVPKAADIRDIWIITVPTPGAWAPGDEVHLSIGQKTLVITLGQQTEDNHVAQAIADAWNAGQRLDGTLSSTDAVSNFGGAEFGEFSEAQASVVGNVVTITGVTSGKPIELEAAFASATDADIELVNTQPATGKNFWDNPNNWAEGSVPQDGDDLVLRDSDVSILYGLPDVSGATDMLLLNIYHYSSFTGHVGLPPINRDNTNKPYPEYRRRGPVLDDGALGNPSTWTFGIGSGPGSQLIVIGYGGNTGKVTVRCHGMAPPVQVQQALNLSLSGEGANRVTVLNGTVRLAADPAVIDGCAMDKLDVVGGTVFVADNSSDGCVATITGGVVTVYGPQDTEYGWVQVGGTTIFQDYGGTLDLRIDGGRVVWNSSSGAPLGIIITGSGIFDAAGDVRPFNVTNTVLLHRGASLLDPYHRGRYLNGIQTIECGLEDVTIQKGEGVNIEPDPIP